MIGSSPAALPGRHLDSSGAQNVPAAHVISSSPTAPVVRHLDDKGAETVPAPMVSSAASPSKVSLDITHIDRSVSISSSEVSDNGTATLAQTCRNPAVIKQRASYLFQTVNHAKVIWDPKLKPRGLFGGHLNARSVVSKSVQLIHLLSSSNLDFLCLSETWLQQSTPASVFSVPGYQSFRQDRVGGRGGGVMIYVKDIIISTNVIHLNCFL